MTDGTDLTAQPVNLGGRPTLYTRELADRVLDLISEGKFLPEICAADDMPSESLVYKWRRLNIDGFVQRYELARDMGAEVHLERACQIAAMEPRYIVNEITKERKIDPAFEQWRKTQINQAERYAQLIRPDRFADHVRHQVTVTTPPERLPASELHRIAAEDGLVIEHQPVALAPDQIET